MNELLIVFIVVTAVAVVLQTIILAAVGISLMRAVKRIEPMVARVNEQVLPMTEKVHQLVDDSVPKLQTAVENLTDSTAVVRAQAEKIDGAVDHVVGVVRNQATRFDKLSTRTMERVDTTAAMVQHTVVSPIRRISAVMEGVAAGVGSFTGRNKNGRPAAAKPQGEGDMFI